MHLHAGYTLEHVTDVHRALLDHRFAANHGTGARVVLHHGGVGVTEPVTDDLDVGHAQFQRAIAGGGRRCRGERHRAFVDLIIEAAALQQLTQRLLRRDIPLDRRGLLAGHQLRAEKHLQRRLLTEFAERLAQRLGADMDGLGGNGQRHRSIDRQREGERQPGRFFIVGCGVFHVVRSPVDRKSVRLLMQTSCS